MNILPTQTAQRWIARWQSLRRFCPVLSLVFLLILSPALALAQSGSPFDTGFMALQNLFTGTFAKVASLIAIVIGGYQFAHGEPGAKKALAGVAAGTGIAALAVNVLNWLWGMSPRFSVPQPKPFNRLSVRGYRCRHTPIAGAETFASTRVW